MFGFQFQTHPIIDSWCFRNHLFFTKGDLPCYWSQIRIKGRSFFRRMKILKEICHVFDQKFGKSFVFHQRRSAVLLITNSDKGSIIFFEEWKFSSYLWFIRDPPTFQSNYLKIDFLIDFRPLSYSRDYISGHKCRSKYLIGKNG